MNYFRYKLITPAGEVHTGTVQLPYTDLMSAVSHLERDGSHTINVKKLSKVDTLFTKLGEMRFRKKLTRTAQAELMGNISLMLRSGVTITSALEEAARSQGTSEIAKDIQNLILSIQSGTSFSEAAGKYPHIFPKVIIHLIRIGEETGRLDKMLSSGAKHLKKVQAIATDTKQALLYPAFVFTVMGTGFVFWIYYVAPKIILLFQDMEIPLPLLTRLIISVSQFFKDNFFSMIIFAVLFAAALWISRKGSYRFKKRTDAFLLKLPVLGSIISASNLAFITEYFSLLMNAGIDLLHSMTILIETVSNDLYREKVREVKENLQRGESIADSFQDTVIFPSYVIRMINVGEMSGTLTEQLDNIAGEYRNRLSVLVSTIGKMLEPVVLVFAGVLFAIIIAGLLLPIYDLISEVGV